MLTRVCFGIALLAAVPVWSQVDNTTDASSTSTSQMVTPPLVSGVAYPSGVGSETRSNYLGGGLVFGVGHIDNLFAGSGSPVSDTTYLVQPTISFDQTSSRFHQTYTYSPTFTFYQPTSVLNETDEHATMDFEYRLSPHVALRAADTFEQSSTAFSQPFSSSENGVSGSVPTVTPGIVAPFAKRLAVGTEAELAWQFSRTGMVGMGGTFTELHFPDLSQAPGLYDSNSRGGSAFVSHRLGGSQYFGATYQYARILTYPAGAEGETQTHTVLPFYTVYVTPTITFTVAGGPQYYEISQYPLPVSHAWATAASASAAWQTAHTNFAASFSRVVTAGSGLTGAFQSSSVNVSGRWQMSHTWTVGAGGAYAINNTVATLLPSTSSIGGHSITGTGSVEHEIGQHFRLACEYDRMHQNYSGVAAIAGDPNTDRELISVFYRFSRPLGQ
jgi:hypothetical protein